MITEEMLTAAAGEVSGAMVSSIQEQPHRFSPGFEGKLRTLTRRAEHPVWYRVQQAAAILVALVTAFTALYMASPTVHAAVDAWSRSTFGSYFQYSPLLTTPPEVEYDYYLPEAFDGYILKEVVEGDNETMYVYSNESGQFLYFDYYRNTTNRSILLGDVDDDKHISCFVGSVPADVYIATEEGEPNIIVWSNPTENVLFCIQATASDNQLIAMAEKVDKIPKK